MIDLSINYLGLKLKNPIIIASSGLSNSIEKIKKLEENGAGAIVLKSLFEEQLIAEYSQGKNSTVNIGYNVENYISSHIGNNSIEKYINLIKEAKAKISIPIIASINCIGDKEWTNWAKKFEDAGADALEINLSILPSDESKNALEVEKMIFAILKKIRQAVEIPIALKMSLYSTTLATMVKTISLTHNVNGIVLFNRFYNPDIDIENMKVTSSNVFSNSTDNGTTLRWLSILSPIVDNNVDLIATTGIHNGETVVKQLLAGATAVQIASAIYIHGPEIILVMLKVLEDWMIRHNFKSVSEFKGKLSFNPNNNTVAFERIQFMKHFGGIE